MANARVTKTSYQARLLAGEEPWSGRNGKGGVNYRRQRAAYLKRLEEAVEALGWKLSLDLVKKPLPGGRSTRVKVLVLEGPDGKRVHYNGP
jgi:hypothetical protein